MRILRHLPQASDEHRTLDGERAHQIREILALDNADVLKSQNRVIAQLQCFPFHCAEPALEAREVEWILLTGIHHQYWARGFELRASAFGQNRYGRRGTGFALRNRSSGEVIRVRRRFIAIGYAATFSSRYSWCNPPSTGRAMTREPSGSVCLPLLGSGSRFEGSGIPGPRLECGRD